MRHQLLILLFLFILSSCKKDPYACVGERASVVYFLDQAAKDYCFFQEGSWWVYTEMNSGAQDSVYIDSSFIEWQVDSTWCYSTFDWGYYRPNDTVFINHREVVKVYTSSTHYKRTIEYTLKRENQFGAIYDDDQSAYYEGFLMAPELEYGGTFILDSLEVQAGIFTNVFWVIQAHSRIYMEGDELNEPPYSEIMNYYWVPNIGLVKRVKYNHVYKDEVWELTKYNVQQ